VAWEHDGITKKALHDAVLCFSGTHLFDIKTSANPFTFNRMASSKYWIQDHHYTEGAGYEWGDVQGFTFLVAYKEEPYLCEPVTIKGDKTIEYTNLCRRYHRWVLDGKQPKGYLPRREFYLR
jgi:hypothetical protein